MSKRSAWIQTGIFLVFIFAFFIINLILPDKEFSERENRVLAQMPKFTINDLFFGNFTSKFESYTTDQFTFRDSWTTLKARAEFSIGKQENNGVYLCSVSPAEYENAPSYELLIEQYKFPAQKQIDTNLIAIETLIQNIDVPVYLALVPGAAEIWSDRLPENAPNDSQKELIDSVYSKTSAIMVDMFSPLYANRSEYIFFHTDHHWTSLGAYYGYTALMNAMGMTCHDLDFYNRKTVSDEFYGTIYSTSGMSWVKPDVIETFVDSYEGLKITNYPQGTPLDGLLYDNSFLEAKDKYAMFLGGNTPLMHIDTGIEDAPSLLIIRDSYIDSQVPLLLDSFSEIHLIDLRYYKASLETYIDENQIDNILICYSVTNFSTDSNIFLLGY